MSRVMHMFQAFRTEQEAKEFGKGVLLTPRSRGRNREEYRIVGLHCDLNEYPYVRVWNERVED
jgi:hypothetical protein